ncbi:MAG: sugar porter family MFS transporter [Verrucomicrobia bacterium]|nr:sugar porter family MFS transporter [Verrucomicrobiota bacterium]
MPLESRTQERCTAYLLFVVAVAAFGGFLYGFHTGIISGALIFLTPAYQLSIVDQGMVVSIILLGGLFGALVSGTLADLFGRKRTIALTSTLFIAGAAIIALSNSYETLLLGRFISGLGVGIISLSGPLYLAEISPPHYRGSFVSLFQLAITLGILASFAVNYIFAGSSDWRWMFAMGIFPAVLQMIALFFLPETPAWLFKKGLEKFALSTLGRLRKDKHWLKQVDAMKLAAKPHKSGAWKTLISLKLRFILIVGLILSAFQQITGINTVIFYAPKIFEEAGFASATGAIVASLGIGVINVLATLFSVWLLDKVGRRVLLLVGIAGMVVSLGFLAFAFFTESQFIDKIAVGSLMAYVSFFAIGLGPVTWVILSEIYPLKVRGAAMTVAIFTNWACNYLVALTFLDFIKVLGPHGTFFLYSLISIVAFWFIYRFIPETKGKSLEEIETLISR